MNDPKTPSEQAVERMRQEGLHQDSQNLNRFTDRNGRSAGSADDDHVKIENGMWEKA